MSDIKPKSGTREWAIYNKNIQLGCEHGCRYCYARSMAERFGRADEYSWRKNIVFNQKEINKKSKKLNGRIMFPTTHDITPFNVKESVEFLKRWLIHGNEFLIVSKPHLSVIDALTTELAGWKDQITFRFTIGSTDNDRLFFWEPGATNFNERLESLKLSFNRGFKTSVSCEPFLDETIDDVVKNVLPFVTDTVWIGKMNKVKIRVKTVGWNEEDMKNIDIVLASQTDEKIASLYNRWKDNPKIKWKESIKAVMGLPEEEIG